MVSAVVDTSVLVDVLRLRSTAVDWFYNQNNLAITPLIQMELIAGAASKVDQQKPIQFIKQMQMLPLLPEDVTWAMEQQLQYSLSHNVGMNDCLIAATAQRLNLPLMTTNLKHFVPLLGTQVQRPY
jgi:predicted nucleic acid-binding protein